MAFAVYLPMPGSFSHSVSSWGISPLGVASLRDDLIIVGYEMPKLPIK
ncbi:MAG TPA: hypothetical protein V6C71_15170 [Coleofasciculaceae cyanobacterium]|jgi:hypothetical protein